MNKYNSYAIDVDIIYHLHIIPVRLLLIQCDDYKGPHGVHLGYRI